MHEVVDQEASVGILEVVLWLLQGAAVSLRSCLISFWILFDLESEEPVAGTL